MPCRHATQRNKTIWDLMKGTGSQAFRAEVRKYLGDAVRDMKDQLALARAEAETLRAAEAERTAERMAERMAEPMAAPMAVPMANEKLVRKSFERIVPSVVHISLHTSTRSVRDAFGGPVILVKADIDDQTITIRFKCKTTSRNWARTNQPSTFAMENRPGRGKRRLARSSLYYHRSFALLEENEGR